MSVLFRLLLQFDSFSSFNWLTALLDKNFLLAQFFNRYTVTSAILLSWSLPVLAAVLIGLGDAAKNFVHPRSMQLKSIAGDCLIVIAVNTASLQCNKGTTRTRLWAKACSGP